MDALLARIAESIGQFSESHDVLFVYDDVARAVKKLKRGKSDGKNHSYLTMLSMVVLN